MGAARPGGRALFARGSWTEASRIAEILRKETVGGALLLAAAVLALVWANSRWSGGYAAVRDFTIGPAALHLDLSLGTWASDGLLAVFFFVVGLELKREFVAGDLRDPRRAVVPVAAAVGGVVLPALIFVAVNLDSGGDALRGWAIPTATDIAFALAVLAVIGTHLPAGLRTFLLTLAVVDDLIAITIIAVFYTEDLAAVPLLLALVPLAGFTLAVQRRLRSWWVLLPLAVLTWALVHASGVHATVAGVLLGFAVGKLSAGVAAPVFAFFAAGVTIGGLRGFTDALADPVALGIVAGLVAGKTIGVFATTFVLARFTRASLDSGLRWVDVFGLAMLAGVGFTVSLLIGELAFGDGGPREQHVTIGILAGSVTAAGLAAIVLRIRNRVYRTIAEQESIDLNRDGIPDAYTAEAETPPDPPDGSDP